MRVGVTGSSGFIGSSLAQALGERGDEVIRFVRPDSTAHANRCVRWDPSRQLVDENDLSRVGGFDAVVNLAGAGVGDHRWTTARKEEILRSRFDSTVLLVDVLRSLSNGTAVLVSGSAIGIYGSRGDEKLDESSSVGHDYLSNVCSQWEAAASTLAQQGTVVANLRTGIVMSSQGGSLKRQLPLFRLGLGGPFSRGQQWLSPISLPDEVRAILWILDRQLSGPLNLTCPTPLPNATFAKILGQELHRPTIIRIPAVALKVALGSQLTSEAILASQRVHPKALLESGFVFENADSTSIVKAAILRPSN
jgi:hypothetical protein